jgi:hypothetical protein
MASIENIPMLVLAMGFVFTAALFLKAGYRGGAHSPHLGSVSDHWVAAYRASEPASST